MRGLQRTSQPVMQRSNWGYLLQDSKYPVLYLIYVNVIATAAGSRRMYHVILKFKTTRKSSSSSPPRMALYSIFVQQLRVFALPAPKPKTCACSPNWPGVRKYQSPSAYSSKPMRQSSTRCEIISHDIHSANHSLFITSIKKSTT